MPPDVADLRFKNVLWPWSPSWFQSGIWVEEYDPAQRFALREVLEKLGVVALAIIEWPVDDFDCGPCLQLRDTPYVPKELKNSRGDGYTLSVDIEVVPV